MEYKPRSKYQVCIYVKKFSSVISDPNSVATLLPGEKFLYYLKTEDETLTNLQPVTLLEIAL